MERTLNPKEFAVLQALEASDAPLTQRVLAGICNMSVGTVNKLAAQLSERGLAAEGRITDQGRAALEPYRVKRAVLIAAGFGERLMPITLNTPKPLVRVRGERIIDSLLDALGAAEIEEVYIVRGYLKEQFDQLLHKYPNIAFIDNDQYNEANNISSIVAARDKLSNSKSPRITLSATTYSVPSSTVPWSPFWIIFATWSFSTPAPGEFR